MRCVGYVHIAKGAYQGEACRDYLVSVDQGRAKYGEKFYRLCYKIQRLNERICDLVLTMINITCFLTTQPYRSCYAADDHLKKMK